MIWTEHQENSVATFRWLVWWVVWAFANFFGFGLAFAFGRALALFVGGDVGGNIGSSGVLDVSPYGNAAFGAVVFVTVFVGLACLMQWLVLLGVARNRPETSWSARWPLVVFLLWFIFVLHEPLQLQSLSLHVVEIPVLLSLSALVFRKSVRNRLVALDKRQRATRAGWLVFAVTLGFGVYTAFGAKPWLGNGNCIFCGSVPAAAVGLYFTAVTGPILILQALYARRRKL